MNQIILDSSALLAFIRKEPGAEKMPERAQWIMSSVNYTEVLSVLSDYKGVHETNVMIVEGLLHEIVPFDEQMARAAGKLREETRLFGLSLADRACLALGLEWGLPVYTADRAWIKLTLPLKIKQLRK